jgi:hypothetical protein
MARQERIQRTRQRRGGGDDVSPADSRPEQNTRTKSIIDRLNGREKGTSA